ncbi:hypothetical protein CCR85_00940 [Rhodothalassium salexigens]|uniref:phage head completion protein n=1 Tax=Rhodothalassium salexigens TaxID=1086 RepID=UPI0019124D6E|nr:hypothetical protein [Rhodothalassium salexigens]
MSRSADRPVRDPGRLHLRATWLKAVAEDDAAGGRALSYAPQGPLWISAEPGRAGETVRAGRPCLVRPWSVRCRFTDPHPAPGDRLTAPGHVLDLRAVLDPTGRRLWLAIDAEEICAP